MQTIKRILTSTILAIALATLAGGPAMADTAPTGTGRSHHFASWTFAPNTPSSVAAGAGFVALNGATVTLTVPYLGTDPAPLPVYLSATLDVVFSSGSVGQSASCIATITINPSVTGGGAGVSGYALPNYNLGSATAHAVLVDLPLQRGSAYTVTPQIAANGSVGCVLPGNAAFHVEMFAMGW